MEKYSGHSDGVKKNIDEKFRKLEEELEKSLAQRTEKLHKQREEHYARRSETKRKRRRNTAQDGPVATETLAYEAKLSHRTAGSGRKYSEGFIHRTVRLIKGFSAVRKKVKGQDWYTAEKRNDAYLEVIQDCYAPMYYGVTDAAACGWNFLSKSANDLRDVVLFIGDMIIKALYYLWSFVLLIADLLEDLAYRINVHKRALLQGFIFVAAIGIGTAALVNVSTAYEYSYYGKTLGKVRREADVYDTLEVLGDKLSQAAGANVDLDVERDISFNKVVALGQKIDSDDDILNNLTYMRDLQVNAFVVYVGDRRSVILQSKDAAEKILENIKSAYTAANTLIEYTSVEFTEETDIQEESVLLGDLWNAEDAQDYLKNARIEEGGIEENLLSVATTELVTYTEEINYDVKYVDSASLYKGETEVKSAGKKGETEIIAEVKRVNGSETGRTVVSSKVTKEPVAQVVYRGTKAIPVRAGTGQFAYPLKSYTISSRFGMRWGRMHTGVDLAAPSGTKIYAADGGTITYAGWKGTYGNLIIVDHGGLYQTYYAHCSKILVSPGDNVYKGQNIGLVGSTGRSTGPHCHFEVRYKGSPQNPLNYL